MKMSRLVLAAVLATGCNLSVNMGLDDLNVQKNGDTVSLDGVELPFERKVKLTGTLPDGAALDMRVPFGDLRLTGQDGRGYDLDVVLRTEKEGDGVLTFEGGALNVVSEGGHKVLIDGVAGRLPARLASLAARSAAGRIELSGFDVSGPVTLGVGAGEMKVVSVSATHVSAGSGAGVIELSGGVSESVEINAGVGDTRLLDLETGQLRVDGGAGEVRLERCRMDRAEFEIGIGDLSLVDCEAETLSLDLGVGGADISGGRYGSIEQDTGIGDVRIDAVVERP